MCIQDACWILDCHYATVCACVYVWVHGMRCTVCLSSRITSRLAAPLPHITDSFMPRWRRYAYDGQYTTPLCAVSAVDRHTLQPTVTCMVVSAVSDKCVRSTLR